MNFTKTKIVNAPSDKVWRIFAHEFDSAYKWMASVPHSYAKANGEQFDGAQSAGRVCELNGAPKGVKASEQFLAYDEVAKTCTIRIDFLNASAAFPVNYNQVAFSLVDVGGGKSSMTWNFTSNIKPWAYLMWPLVRLAFGVFIGQIMDELQYYVENDQPHPRKVKAAQKATLPSQA